MRRLVAMLAAGLLAAGTVITSAGVASADTSAGHQPQCSGGYFFKVIKRHVSYYLGTPTNLSPGAAAILKPKLNSTTSWTECTLLPSLNVLLENRGLALTSRDFSPGGNVTVEPPGNGGNGFASQQWIDNAAGPMVVFPNAKTGLFLRVRNSGPVMGQTVTTGSQQTVWEMP
jgi:hypothetical protein